MSHVKMLLQDIDVFYGENHDMPQIGMTQNLLRQFTRVSWHDILWGHSL